MQRKLQEDPLLAIKQREVDERRQVLDNPVKMKQIKEYLESKKRAKKKKKEKKRRKKSKKGSDSEDDSDEDLDSLLLKKLEKFNPDGLQTKGEEAATSKRKSRSPTGRRGKNSSRSPQRRRRSRSRTPPKRRKRSKSPVRRGRSRSSDREPFKRPARPSSAERAQKLAEMTANAKWRNEQRGQRVDKYRKEAKKEEEELRNRSANDESSSSFVREHLRAAAGAGSVESRIKANKHNIQRAHASMDKNFARR